LSELVDYINTLPTQVPTDILDLLSKDASTKEHQMVNAHRGLEDQSVATLPLASPGKRITGKKSLAMFRE